MSRAAPASRLEGVFKDLAEKRIEEIVRKIVRETVLDTIREYDPDRFARQKFAAEFERITTIVNQVKDEHQVWATLFKRSQQRLGQLEKDVNVMLVLENEKNEKQRMAELEEMYRELQWRVRRMSLTHENLHGYKTGYVSDRYGRDEEDDPEKPASSSSSTSASDGKRTWSAKEWQEWRAWHEVRYSHD